MTCFAHLLNEIAALVLCIFSLMFIYLDVSLARLACLSFSFPYIDVTVQYKNRLMYTDINTTVLALLLGVTQG